MKRQKSAALPSPLPPLRISPQTQKSDDSTFLSSAWPLEADINMWRKSGDPGVEIEEQVDP